MQMKTKRLTPQAIAVLAFGLLLDTANFSNATHVNFDLTLLELDSHGKVCHRQTPFSFGNNCDPKQFPDMACDIRVNIAISMDDDVVEQRRIRCPENENRCSLEFHRRFNDVDIGQKVKLIVRAFDVDNNLQLADNTADNTNNESDELIGTFQKQFSIARQCKRQQQRRVKRESDNKFRASSHVRSRQQRRLKVVDIVEESDVLVDETCQHRQSLRIHYKIECLAEFDRHDDNNVSLVTTTTRSSLFVVTPEFGLQNNNNKSDKTTSGWLIVLLFTVCIVVIVGCVGAVLCMFVRIRKSKRQEHDSASHQQQINYNNKGRVHLNINSGDSGGDTKEKVSFVKRRPTNNNTTSSLPSSSADATVTLPGTNEPLFCSNLTTYPNRAALLDSKWVLDMSHVDMKHVLSAGEFSIISYAILSDISVVPPVLREVIVKRARTKPLHILNDIYVHCKLHELGRNNNNDFGADEQNLDDARQFIVPFHGWSHMQYTPVPPAMRATSPPFSSKNSGSGRTSGSSNNNRPSRVGTFNSHENCRSIKSSSASLSGMSRPLVSQRNMTTAGESESDNSEQEEEEQQHAHYENSMRSIAGVYGYCSRGSLLQHLLSLCQSEYVGIGHVDGDGKYDDKSHYTMTTNNDMKSFPLPTSLINLWAYEVASALEFVANRLRVVHRNVSAQNILLDDSLHCKVSDFGVAIILPPNADDVCVVDANVEDCGEKRLAYRWLPPEAQVPTCSYWLNSTDVWSFGVLLWEVLTLGSKPYASVAVQNLSKHLGASSTSSSSRVELAAPWGCKSSVKHAQCWQFVCQSCCQPHPERRAGWATIRSHYATLLTYDRIGGELPADIYDASHWMEPNMLPPAGNNEQQRNYTRSLRTGEDDDARMG